MYEREHTQREKRESCYFTHNIAGFETIRLPENSIKATSFLSFLMFLWNHKIAESTIQTILMERRHKTAERLHAETMDFSSLSAVVATKGPVALLGNSFLMDHQR